MSTHQKVLILDIQGRYSQELSRTIREMGVFCKILPYSTSLAEIKELSPIAIILSGSPSCNIIEQPCNINKEILNQDIPILGIGYGAQLIAHLNDSPINISKHNTCIQQEVEYKSCSLFRHISTPSVCYVDKHSTTNIPKDYQILARTKTGAIVGFGNPNKHIYGLLFHPESKYSTDGKRIIENFLFAIAGARGDWDIASLTKNLITEIKNKINNKKALCAMSGGVDSAVVATLVHKAIGRNLTCVFVDHGLLRKDEAEQVMSTFKDKLGMNLIKVDATQRFLTRLKGITDPETKRKIIGEEFIRVFEEEARKLGKIDYFIQGTIYPDIVESGFADNHLIKSHHNVGGLPDIMDFKEVIEPVKNLFKYEVREVGQELGLSEEVVMRQPFPGPGLAIRTIGEITHKKLDILRQADYLLNEELIDSGISRDIWQYFAVLTNLKSVGIDNGKRSYEYTLGIRAVTSENAMVADFARIPYEILARISSKIIKQVKGINRVVYDITPKPPSTIEWE